MKNLFSIFILLLAVFGTAGCGQSGSGQTDDQENKQNDGYRIVYIKADGTEDVEKIVAENDTDAVKQFTDKVTAIAMKSIDEKEPPFKKVVVLSPVGDTLNKNDELIKAATGVDFEKMAKEVDSMVKSLDEQIKNAYK